MKTIKNYQQARDFLGNKKERPYAHNTRIEIDPLNMGHENIIVKYHDNTVVSMFPDGTMIYSSCGWKTITTKERINWFLPEGFYLYQEKSVWYIVKRGTSYKYGFMDGIAIKNGDVYNDTPASQENAVKKQIKAIKHFVDGYIKALLAGEIKAPSSGDCWYCVMVTDQGKGLGDITGNSDHILSHMEEEYYVPSLVMRANDFRGFSTMTKDGIARLWQGENIGEWQASIVERDVKSSMTAYIKHVLGVAQ